MEKLNEWIKAERGRLTKLATALGITSGAIVQWDVVPAERMGAIARVTGIPMHQLRPDIFQAAGEVAE
jgi:DNA-binding transcriptional regulator YdaS (Cro superfamily)